MGAEQSSGSSHSALQIEAQSKGSSRDMREVDLIARAERKYKTFFVSMKDAYGDEDGAEMFRRVVLSPALYQSDIRRLVQNLVMLVQLT